MATIEERYGCIGCELASCEGCDSFLLVKGATEQKEIDEADPSDAVIMRVLNAIGYVDSWLPVVKERLKSMEG